MLGASRSGGGPRPPRYAGDGAAAWNGAHESRRRGRLLRRPAGARAGLRAQDRRRRQARGGGGGGGVKTQGNAGIGKDNRAANLVRVGSPHPRPLPTRGRGAHAARNRIVIAGADFFPRSKAGTYASLRGTQP